MDGLCEVFQLFEAGGAGDGSGDAGAAHEPGESDASGIRVEIFGDGIESGENAEAASVQEFGDALPSFSADGIFFGAVLAGEKAAGQRVIRNNADVGAEAEGFEIGFVIGAIVEVVVGLEAFVTGPGVFFAETEGFGEAVFAVIGSADDAHFAFLDELGVSLEGFFERRGGIVFVGLVEIDVIGLEALERGFDGAEDVGFGESFVLWAHVETDFGGDDDFGTFTGLLEPVADDGFGLAAGMAGHPGGIDIGGVDEGEAGVGEGVEDLEGSGLIDGPAEDIAAEGERGDFDVGVAEFAFGHEEMVTKE